MSSIKQEQADLDTMLKALEAQEQKPKKKTKKEKCACAEKSCAEKPLEISITTNEAVAERIVDTFYSIIHKLPELYEDMLQADFDKMASTQEGVFQSSEKEFVDMLKDPNKVKNILLMLSTRVGMLEARMSLLEGDIAPAMAIVSDCVAMVHLCRGGQPEEEECE